MKTILALLLTIISLDVFSQNKDSYTSWRIQQGVYEHFDSLGLKRLDEKDTCKCGFSLSYNFYYFVDKSEAYDSILLNEKADEDLIEYLIYYYVNYIIANYPKPKIKEIYIDVDIRQVSNRFNIFRMRRKVKYESTLNINYNRKNI